MRNKSFLKNKLKRHLKFSQGKKKKQVIQKKKNALWAMVAIKHSNRFGKMITKFPIKICKGNQTGTII